MESRYEGGKTDITADRFRRVTLIIDSTYLRDDRGMDDPRRTLEEKRDRLQAEMARMAAPPDEPTTGISFGKRVGEGTSMAVDRLVQVATYDEMQATLNDVTRALVKIDEGTYGSCDNCGADIPPERLEIRPWAVLCVECARR